MKHFIPGLAGFLSFIVLLNVGMLTQGSLSNMAAERKVLDYLKSHLKAGEPVVVSRLYNEVFTAPEERKALDRLYNTVFKIPAFAVECYLKAQKPPTLREISREFNLPLEGEVDALLKIIEYDRRIPRFITRDPKSGEITSLDVQAIRSDPRFGKVIERSLSGWEGRPAPALVVNLIDGKRLSLVDYRGKTCLLYFWFTHCPPCVQITPHLASLQGQFRDRGFQVIGLNADKVLELGYDDQERQAYIRENGINFPVGQVTPEIQAAYGGVSLFPTLFLIDREGIIRGHFVNYQEKATLEKAIQKLLQ